MFSIYNNNPYIQTTTQKEDNPVLNNPITGENLITDSTSKTVYDLASQMGLSGITKGWNKPEMQDYIIQAKVNDWLSSQAYNREKESLQNAKQWEMSDLQKAGLNPFLALSSNSAMASSSPGSVSGGNLTESKNTRERNKQASRDNITTILRGIIAAVGIMVAASL